MVACVTRDRDVPAGKSAFTGDRVPFNQASEIIALLTRHTIKPIALGTENDLRAAMAKATLHKQVMLASKLTSGGRTRRSRGPLPQLWRPAHRCRRLRGNRRQCEPGLQLASSYGHAEAVVTPAPPTARLRLVRMTVSTEPETMSPPPSALASDDGVEIEVADTYRVRVQANFKCRLLRRGFDCLGRTAIAREKRR
jgi:hypothetical protein